MSNDDLIRRGDARRILEEEGFLERSLANLNDLPAMQVAVKPLEWLEIREGQYFEARVIGILYSVRLGSDGVVRWQAGHMGTWHEAPTIESAKAAAQADYEGRIRSALTAQPSPDVAALVEAMVTIRCAILEALRSSSDMDYCLNLSGLAARTDLPRETLRGIIADMRAEGLVSHHKGLWSEEGTPGGAGYAITDDGRAALARVKGGDA